jgi:hypothetical protein
MASSSVPAACGGCDRRWTGSTSAHCTICHEHFSTVANFDAHGVSLRGCPPPSTRTRTKADGTVLPLFKAVERRHGVEWVGFTEDPRFEDGDA